jgi:hypothetical protein
MSNIPVKCSYDECGDIIMVAKNRKNQDNYCDTHRRAAYLEARNARRDSVHLPANFVKKVGYVCVTAGTFRGFVHPLDAWRLTTLEPGSVLRNKNTGACVKWNGDEFTPCAYVAPDVSQTVDIFPGHTKHTHGVTHALAVKCG